MQIQNIIIQEQTVTMPQEARQVIELLNKMDDFTAELRKKILSEIKNSKPSIHLHLEEVES